MQADRDSRLFQFFAAQPDVIHRAAKCEAFIATLKTWSSGPGFFTFILIQSARINQAAGQIHAGIGHQS
jgi:hypothetical protein